MYVYLMFSLCKYIYFVAACQKNPFEWIINKVTPIHIFNDANYKA